MKTAFSVQLYVPFGNAKLPFLPCFLNTDRKLLKDVEREECPLTVLTETIIHFPILVFNNSVLSYANQLKSL